jgi:hypothetical protein
MRLTRTSGSVGGLGGRPPRSTRPAKRPKADTAKRPLSLTENNEQGLTPRSATIVAHPIARCGSPVKLIAENKTNPEEEVDDVARFLQSRIEVPGNRFSLAEMAE